MSTCFLTKAGEVKMTGQTATSPYINCTP